MAFTVNNKVFKDQEEFVTLGRGCATKIPSPVEIRRVDEEISLNKSRRILFDRLEVRVVFTHLTYGSSGLITREQRDGQIKALNRAFNGTGISFAWDEDEVSFVDNHNWYRMGYNSFSEREAKTSLAIDSAQCLNFYTGGLQDGLLGWASFPFDLAGDPIMDGVVLLDESLPGGNAAPYNLGMTGVHEVGHWLGLYHTFQDGCGGIGDHVNDTPAHYGPNFGKPEDGLPHNACREGDFAPIHNYMNYVDDEWMNELTEAQEQRIREQVMMYRTGLLNA